MVCICLRLINIIKTTNYQFKTFIYKLSNIKYNYNPHNISGLGVLRLCLNVTTKL